MKKVLLTLSSLTSMLIGYSQTPTDSLKLYLPFSGNAKDLSGNALNGTVNGATLTTDRFGNANNAYYFDGSSNNIKVSNNTLLNIPTGNSFSLSFWLKHDGNNFDKYVISKYNGTTGANPSYSIGTGTIGNSYSWYEFTPGNGKENRGNIMLTDNKWHHFVTVFTSGGNITTYIDNVLDVTSSISYTGSIINNLDLYIGCSSNVQQFYKGSVDDIRIYKKALSVTEISKLYNESSPCINKMAVTDTLIINAVLTGINPPNDINTIKVFPNPAKDHITIDNGKYSNMGGYSIKIQNTLSQTVFQSVIAQQQFYVDLNSFTGMGTYFLYLHDNTSKLVEVKKIILQ